jgi:hypothetical protein
MSDGDGDRPSSEDQGGDRSAREPTPRVQIAVRGPQMLGAFGSYEAARRCSFCGRSENAVARLATARGSYICGRCVHLAAAAIDDPTTTGNLIRIKPERVEPANRTDAEDAIERAYETVLARDLPKAERAAAIESGANLLPTMREVDARVPARIQLDVTIEYIRFVDDREAEVGFTLIFPGPRPVPGMQIPSKGYAVEQDGTWKMARATYAELVSRLGITVPPAD